LGFRRVARRTRPKKAAVILRKLKNDVADFARSARFWDWRRLTFLEKLFAGIASHGGGFPQERGMKASFTRITFHLGCLIRRPSRWRFFTAGIGRELALLIQLPVLAKA